jgi:hypothetical protein
MSAGEAMNAHLDCLTRPARITLLAVALAVAVSWIPPAAHAAEEDSFVCMEDSQEKCDYENRNMALFIQGRDAFDRGRESGDFTEAHDIAAELMARKDLKHGKALMKFIYLQFAQGAHKDLVQAYRWVAADAAGGVTYPRLDLGRVLDQMSKHMTPEQLAEARR